MKREKISENEMGLLMLLRSLKGDALSIVELGREALRRGRGSIQRARRCLELGEAELRSKEHTVSFLRAVETARDARKDRRSRTQSDFRYITRRFMRLCPGLAHRRIRTIKPKECAEWIQRAFHTPAQQKKARITLSGVFATACKQGWCAENPVKHVPTPRVVEKRIPILDAEGISRLMKSAQSYRGGICLPAVGMMLYAGIRPHEVARLTWEHVHLKERIICIYPEHSKTGGARHVTIQPKLAELLSRLIQKQGAPDKSLKICPRNWLRHWRALHKLARFSHWQPDILRHTFATHHLTTHRSYASLQLEMGHRSAELLRTRYIACAV